jgi:HEAT repeat protein
MNRVMSRNPVGYHSDETLLVKRALENNSSAVRIFLDNLGSAKSQQCKVLQETIHDFKDPLIWFYLLRYIATHRWGNESFRYTVPDPFAFERIDQAIVEVFIQDEDNLERAAKDAVLYEALESSGEYLDYAAAYILGLRHDPKAIPILAEIIDKGNRKWKLRAVRALSTLKNKDCSVPLMKALTTDRGKLHREARRALQNLGSLAETVWLEALNHPDRHIRWEAAHGLGKIGDARAAPTLAEGLYDESYVVRWASANVLASLGEKGVPATLAVLCSHEISEPFRQATYHALHGIKSLRARKKIMPVLYALNDSTGKERVSYVARDVLLDWEEENEEISRV